MLTLLGALLAKHGLRVQDLAVGSGLKHQTATDLVLGRRVPRVSTLEAAARWLTRKTGERITPLGVVTLSRQQSDPTEAIRAALAAC
jgi:transcriptional regulator with XRE-family HTH domain